MKKFGVFHREQNISPKIWPKRPVRIVVWVEGEIRGYERGKKAAYAEYRKAREEMKELLTAKANIDRILEFDKEQEEANERREKEAEQR